MFEKNAYKQIFSFLGKQQKDGKNSAVMQQENWNLILRLIYKNGSISRKDLAEKTGLTQATVTIIINELLSQNLIQENGLIEGGNGRRVQSFSIVNDHYIIAIRVTEVYIKVALFDIGWNILYVEKVFFQTEDIVTEIKEIVLKHIRDSQKLVGREKILCVTMGVEHKYRLIDGDYAIWDDLRQTYCHIGQELYDVTGHYFYVDRAINLATYEVWNKYKKESVIDRDTCMLVYIQLGYDLESTIIVNNKILYGKNGRCGQLHDLRMKTGDGKTATELIAVPALLKRAKELLEQYPNSEISEITDLNIRDVIAGYENGDLLCKQVYDEVIEYLGYLMGFILNWMDPNILSIGDEIPVNKEFIEELQREAEKYTDERKATRIIGFPKERKTRNDPVLIGGAKYAFDLMIGEIENI